MKNTSLFRRILSVALVVAMVCSLLVPSISAETPKAAATTEELELIPMDPGALESQKLAEGDANDDSATKAGFESADVVRVSIVLDKASTLEAGFNTKGIADNAAAKAYRQGLRADQAAMTAKIEKALNSKLEVKWNLTLAANIISANVQYGQIDAIKAIDGVKDVFLENRYEPEREADADEPDNGSASYMIGSNLVWADGYTGAGSKVAVIDTGADSLHQSFSGEGLEYAFAQTAEEKGMTYDAYVASLNLLTPEAIDAVKDQLNANIGSGAAAYRNTKVAYGYNYVDKDVSYIDHDKDSQGEHGSHVSGISTANRFIKVGEEYKPALEAVGTQGVAPDAQLVVMKVFGKGGGAYDSDYMVAIEDAIVLGCDSANLSLGGGAPGFTFSNGYEEVMNKIVENAMVVAISAGNSGMWYDTPKNSVMQYPYLYADDINYATDGSPGSFTNSLCVASVDNAGQTGMPLLFGDRHVFYSETSGYGNAPIATIAGQEYEYVLVDGPGVDDNDHVGQEGDQFLALGSEVLTGKIAMCYRGSSSFFAKANAAAAQGAAGVIIINNQDGVINMNLTGYNYTVPAVSILKADGDAIKADSEAVKDADGNVLYYKGTMSVSDALEVSVPEISDTVTVSSFSSYGTPTSMVLKPEILAPGGSIYSVAGYNYDSQTNTYNGGHEAYELMSGTSMASPQVAGMAAVMGQYIRENDLCAKTGRTERQLVNSLLMSTAHPVYDSYGEYWSVIRVGSGLANVADAIAAKSYIMMDENATLFPDSAKDGKVKAELGDDPDCTGEYSYSFTLYPMEGSKAFTLRTDIFTQWIAGNGGYGLLADTGTSLIGSETTYEINGTTYEDTYTLEADVNKDGETNAADAQAILDYVAGELAEGAEFDEAAADVDGDEAITTYDAKLILDSAASPVITITEPTEVKVNIKLDGGDVATLLNYMTGGFYVEGYTYVMPEADEEGNMDVVHSIPVFGFCGSYTGPAMLDRTSVIDELYGTGKEPYIANKNINYMTVKTADGESYVFTGNPYAVEDTFPADRLALSSESTIQAFNYLNIRNIATLGFAVQDEEGHVLGASATATMKYPAYYYVNGGTWMNTSPSNFSVGKKLSAYGKEGDKLTVGFYALPEYYGIVDAKMNGTVATSAGLDRAGLARVLESGIVGDGAAIKYTVTLDDTAPVVKGAMRDLITGNLTVVASDENYVAYVAVLNKAGTKVYAGAVPQQTEAGEEVSVPLDFGDEKVPSEVVLMVADYAGNEVAYKINLGGDSDEEVESMMIGFVNPTSTYGPGSGNRAWVIDPATVNVTSSDSTGVELYANVPMTVTAAEYVDGYVFMAADDGWFYAASVDALDEASPMGQFSDTVETIYDMAFNTTDKTLYALGSNNTIYSVDLADGKLTPAFVVTLDGMTGENAIANRLAIDDKGTYYLANNGTIGSIAATAAKLFKFEYVVEPEEEEPVSELGELVNAWGFESEDEMSAWTIVNANGDATTWERATAKPHNGSYHLQNKWNSSASVDDWAISPAIDLTGLDNATLSVWLGNNSINYTENFAVYVGSAATVEGMTEVLAKTPISVNGYVQKTIDLADYVGSTIYVGIRHFDSQDQFYAFLDDVEIYTVPTQVEPEPEVPEVVEITAEAVGAAMGVYNRTYGGAFAWDHDTDKLYLASNYNAKNDTDHVLWTVDTKTGRASKTNDSARLYGSVRGLFIVPGKTHIIHPVDVATELNVTPTELDLLKGQKTTLKAVVMPWNLTDKDVTWETADETIATVNNGVVTGVSVGTTTITVTTVAEPHLTAEVAVTVADAPVAELRGVIWDEQGKGQASVFQTNDTNNWQALAVLGQLYWGTVTDDILVGSTADDVVWFDADTLEPIGQVSMGDYAAALTLSDAASLTPEIVEALGTDYVAMGPANNGTYLWVIDNVDILQTTGFNLSSAYADDPMAVIAFVGYEDVDADGDTYENTSKYAMITESGMLWYFYIIPQADGLSMIREQVGQTSLDLTGVSDVSNSIWASMVYDAENEFFYVSLYNGSDDYAHLYALDANDITRMGECGDFNADVWPVVGLYEYTPATELTLKVSPTDVNVFEGATANVSVRVKLGETNEYTAVVTDPSICSFEDGVITGLKAGETTIVITTVDTNEAGEHLTATINVTVEGKVSVDLSVVGQVTDANGARFTEISLDGPVASTTGAAAPFDVASGGRAGSVYLAATDAQIVALDAETYQPVTTFNPDPAGNYSQYPAMDIANYPCFVNAEGTYDENKALFTTNLGWVVKPDYYGWNLSSYLPDMAAIAFAGIDEAEDDDGNTVNIYVYYILTTAGKLWEMDVDYAAGKINNLADTQLDTGITVSDQSALSMAFVANDDETVYGLAVANNEDQTLRFIDFQTGEVGFIGALDATNLSGLVGYFDDFDAADENPDPQPVGGETLVSYGFETEDEFNAWTMVDDDGDGYTWSWIQNVASWFEGEADLSDWPYEGTGSILSASFINTVGELTPDNWAISPAIDLTNAQADAVFSVYAKGVDSNYASEKFALYAGTTPDPTSMTKISNDFTATASYKEYTASLSDFVGQSTVYVAIRHYNISDMYILSVDNVSVKHNFEAPTGFTAPKALRANKYEGMTTLSAMLIGDGVEMTKLGETVNETVGGTNAIKGELTVEPIRMPVDETTAGDGTVKIVLTEDKAVTNGLFTVTYNADVLTFVDAVSELPYKSIHHEIQEPAEGEEPALRTGVITIAYASAEEIAAESVLATLNFTYTGDSVETTVVVTTLERNDNVAVEEDPLVIEVKGEKSCEHVYGDPVWTWAEDFSSATATFTCTLCNETVEVEAAITADYQASKTVYTATVEFNGNTYTDVKEGPAMDVYTLTTELKDGDKVVIVNNGFNKALSNAAAQEKYLAGQDVVPTDNKVFNPAAETVWTVRVTENGYKFEDAEGKTLTATVDDSNKTGLGLGEDHNLWVLENTEAEATYYVKSADVTYNEKGQYLEYYSSKDYFSVYGLQTGKENMYTFQFYAKLEDECQITFFTDIDEYPHGTDEHSAIEWAYLNGITAGTGDGTTFEPATIVSRAQAMVFLYAAEGRPEFEEPDAKFTDVKKKDWFYTAVMWAVANGITGGTGDGTTFSPKKTCSRAEILQFFYAAEGKPAYTIANPYSDVKDKHWYKDGAIWAYENGLEHGENGKFNAKTDCTRLSTVLYLYRYITGNARVD